MTQKRYFLKSGDLHRHTTPCICIRSGRHDTGWQFASRFGSACHRHVKQQLQLLVSVCGSTFLKSTRDITQKGMAEVTLDNSLASGPVLLEGAMCNVVNMLQLQPLMSILEHSVASSYSGQEAQMLQCLQANGRCSVSFLHDATSLQWVECPSQQMHQYLHIYTKRNKRTTSNNIA